MEKIQVLQCGAELQNMEEHGRICVLVIQTPEWGFVRHFRALACIYQTVDDEITEFQWSISICHQQLYMGRTIYVYRTVVIP
jgi:hypothetical protein